MPYQCPTFSPKALAYINAYTQCTSDEGQLDIASVLNPTEFSVGCLKDLKDEFSEWGHLAICNLPLQTLDPKVPRAELEMWAEDVLNCVNFQASIDKVIASHTGNRQRKKPMPRAGSTLH